MMNTEKRSEVLRMAAGLMREHGLFPLWKITLDRRSTRRYGMCDPKHFNLKFLLRWRDTKTGRLLPKK